MRGDVWGRSSDGLGWQDDPTGRFPQRYRMSSGWTRRVRVGEAEAVDPVGVDQETPTDSGADQGASAGRWSATGGEGNAWRPDPTGRFEERWWDGERFTRRVRHRGAEATDTISPPARRRRGRRAGSDAGGPGWRPDPDGDGERYHDGHDWTATWRPVPDGTPARPPGSRWAWLPRSVVVVLGAIALLLLAALVATIVAVAT